MNDDTDPRYPHFETTLPGVGPMPPAQRRSERRHTFHAQVEAIPLDGRCEPIHGTTEDICPRGVFVRAATRLPIDSLVLLRLDTAHGTLKLSGRVVHTIEGMGFGCEFIDLDERQSVALRLMVSVRTCTPAPRTIH